MQTISTDVFTISIPERFDRLTTSKVRIQADDTQTQRDVQGPLVSIALLKIKDLNTEDYLGNTLQEKFEDSCLSLSYKSEKIESEIGKFKGLETFILHAHTDAAWQDTHFKIRYFYAGILLDDSYILEFRALHEKLSSDELADWVMPTFESLEILGDAVIRDQTWQQHLLDREEEGRRYREEIEAKDEAKRQAKKNKVYNTSIPENGGELFEIVDFDFQFIKEKSVCNISDFDGMLAIEIAGKIDNKDEGIRKKLLSEYNNEGEIIVNLSVKGILNQGVLSGNFRYEEGRTGAPYWLHIRFNGLEYGLDFHGNVVFTDNWIVIAGELRSYDQAPVFEVRIAQKINPEMLDWSLYRFSSIEETKTIAREKVRLLSFENPNFLKLPEAVFSFENLEDFSISQQSNNWKNEKLPLNEIQPEIGQLTRLKKFYLNGLSLEKLPQTIAQLKKIEFLSINNCKVNELPAGIWQLPNLKTLWLSSNLLTKIPEEIDLPEIQHLTLAKNQLKTLPKALAKQPKLKKIDLKDNPLEKLPKIFNDVEAIDLSMENKLRLLDFDYKGADGKGMATWDDSMFWSQNDADLITEVDEVFKSHKIKKHKAALCALVKKSIGFRHTAEDDYALVGNHRFGGMPDLPDKIEYPEFFDDYNKEKYKYEFIAQINCTEIAGLQDYLPRKGMLYFFLETIHNVYHGVHSPCRVLYVEDDSGVVSGRRFKFAEADYYEMVNDAYTPYRAKADKINNAPSFYARYVNTHLFIGAKDLQQDEEFLVEADDIFKENINDQNAFEYAINAYGFSQHEQPELQASLQRKGKPEDWMILLTVTSSGDMQWGDAGDLFFVIHKSDLAKSDFSNVFVTIESS